MLTSCGFPFLNWGIKLYFINSSKTWSAIFLQFPASTGYFSNSTGSSLTNCRFSPIIAGQYSLCRHVLGVRWYHIAFLEVETPRPLLRQPRCLAFQAFQPVFKIEALLWVSFWRALTFQPFYWRAESNPRRQSKNIEMKYKTHIKLVHESYGTCFQYNVKN